MRQVFRFSLSVGINDAFEIRRLQNFRRNSFFMSRKSVVLATAEERVPCFDENVVLDFSHLRGKFSDSFLHSILSSSERIRGLRLSGCSIENSSIDILFRELLQHLRYKIDPIFLNSEKIFRVSRCRLHFTLISCPVCLVGNDQSPHIWLLSNSPFKC